MKLAPGQELPEELVPTMHLGTRLAVAMIAYLAIEAAVLAFLLAGSQAIMALIVEDVLEIVAPAAYLITLGRSSQDPDPDFPYGHHRDVTLGAFASSLALLGFGLVMLGVSGISLLGAEHPTIATAEVLGLSVWKGWLAIGWLVPTAVIPWWLARRISDPAETMNNRVLDVAGDLLSADWHSTFAGIVGVVGVAAGLWWLDSTAAMVISLSVIRDGVRATRQTSDMLLDRQPTELGSGRTVDLVGRLQEEVDKTDWVGESQVRLRAHGQVFFGDVVVEIGDREVSGKQLAELENRLRALDWRLLEVLVVPVQELERGGRPQSTD